MKLESPLHAEHQLDQLAGQFAHWRQTRTHPGQRFPQVLWDQAVALAATLPPSRVAKQLRLRLTDWKKQMATSPASPAPAPGLGFMEVPAAPPGSQPPAAIPIELSSRWHPAVHPLFRLGPAAGGGGARLCGGPIMLQLTPQAASLWPRNPSISAKASMAWAVSTAPGDNPWRAPSASSATVPARRSNCCCMKARATG